MSAASRPATIEELNERRALQRRLEWDLHYAEKVKNYSTNPVEYNSFIRRIAAAVDNWEFTFAKHLFEQFEEQFVPEQHLSKVRAYTMLEEDPPEENKHD